MPPSVEVIIPAARGNLCQRLIWSLARQTRPPDYVTVVGNEADTDLDPWDLKVQLLRLESDVYRLGTADVCFRRNAGAFESKADFIIFQDDDQLAPRNLVESAMRVMMLGGFVWGHHRFIDFPADLYHVIDLPPEAGRSREHPPNAWHQWYSCYAGNVGMRRSLFVELGGFDMAFDGFRGHEDQQFGHRLMDHFGLDRVYIHEPPFAWHPEETSHFPPAPSPPTDVVNSLSLVQPYNPSLVTLSRLVI